jgi:hypothetical protein
MKSRLREHIYDVRASVPTAPVIDAQHGAHCRGGHNGGGSDSGDDACRQCGARAGAANQSGLKERKSATCLADRRWCL